MTSFEAAVHLRDRRMGRQLSCVRRVYAAMARMGRFDFRCENGVSPEALSIHHESLSKHFRLLCLISVRSEVQLLPGPLFFEVPSS